LGTQTEVLSLLDEVLGLKGRTAAFTDDTPLLGALPELDSMTVVSLLAALEERFSFSIDDDEVGAATFASVGSLVEFVENKLKG
jgi:acyl carrier protein